MSDFCDLCLRVGPQRSGQERGLESVEHEKTRHFERAFFSCETLTWYKHSTINGPCLVADPLCNEHECHRSRE